MANNKIIFKCDNAKNGEVQIIVLADVHLGNERFDETYFKAVIDYIEQTPNCYFILNGDLIENTIHDCPASIFSDTLHPDTQITMVCNYLSKIVKQGKCINATIGNHELRSSKKVGINPMDMIITHLSKYDNTLPERYYPTGVYTFLNVPYRKKNISTFLLYNQHGSGGGSTLSGAITKSVKQKGYINAHVLIRSHTHKPYAIPQKILMPNLNNYDIKEERAWIVSNGAFMDYWGGYGQMNGFEPQDTSMPVITLKANRRAYRKDGKLMDIIDKYSDVQLRDKNWFLDQVRNYGKNKNK